MPTLYLVPTPIGNLEDVSLRVLRVLKEVSLIAAEDTRTTRKLLNSFKIHTMLTSFYEHNEPVKIEYLLRRIDEGDIALVSEAGTPGISDPGYKLIDEAIKRGIKVIPLPGPSAVTTAISVSGLPSDKFLYLGFLPRKAGERTRVLTSIATLPYTLILFEAPHRLLETLSEIKRILGERYVAVCRELSKLHEEIFRGSVTEALVHFQNPLGEFTLVLSGAVEAGISPPAELDWALRYLKDRGLSAKDATNLLSKLSPVSKHELYERWLKI